VTLIAVGLAVATAVCADAQSVSLGTPEHGSLQGGVSIPVEGDGFVSYSRLGNWLGRQYVNSRVRDILLTAFKVLHAAQPDRIYVIGETGLKAGGRFRPHRSHQNGLSVDIFMPVRDEAGKRVLMPTPSWRKFGYGLEFDAEGKGEGLVIDFTSLAELLAE
jgi:penicillin-insensitive murein DD-endopeptidase